MTSGYTSQEFQAVCKALLACNDADRAYLRRWILRWLTTTGASVGRRTNYRIRGVE